MKFEAVGFLWDGFNMITLERFRTLANRQYRAGNEYALIPHKARSDAAHGLYFKCVDLGWKNCPEDMAHRFPSSEHFRKWCLVQEGFFDEHQMLCDNNSKARATAALCRKLDQYAVIKVSGPIVTVWMAKSQSHEMMGQDEFIASMQRVLERIAGMLGITVSELTEAAKAAMKTQGSS